MELKNDLLLRALAREPVDRTPAWIMRQAGRYLPEYLKTRAEAGSFMNLCRNPELACEVTLQPLRRFPLDAAIIFSDILTIPDAMGLGLYFSDGEGPRFERPIESEAQIRNLPEPDVRQSLAYVMDAIRLTRRTLEGSVPLIGFSGSPWTLATYMIEGGSSKSFGKVRALVAEQPELMHMLLEKLADAVIAYVNAQIESGAQVIQVFDTWGGALGGDVFAEFSLRHLHRVVAGVKRHHGRHRVPIILFCKGCHAHLEAQADTGCDALGLDWTVTMAEARARVGHRVALQGNLNPDTLLTDTRNIESETARVLASFGRGNGHVFNLGHGITPDVPPENLAFLLDAVRRLSPGYH